MYNLAKHLWEQCREGYKFTGEPQSAPDALTKLEWCASDNHALNYFENLISWTTRPKAQVEFSIPLNGSTNGHQNLELELLDEVKFSDKIYTQEQVFTGYITKIEPDLKKNEIKLGVMFEPDDYSDVIVERGIPLNDSMPLIIESGNRNNTIIEGGGLL